MKALTICQPYAELIMNGSKPIENRTWATNYRGPLAIHAGKSKEWLSEDDDPAAFVYGAVVGVVDLYACVPVEKLPVGLVANEHANGPWCWLVANPKRLQPAEPFKGALGLWDLPRGVEMLLRKSALPPAPQEKSK